MVGKFLQSNNNWAWKVARLIWVSVSSVTTNPADHKNFKEERVQICNEEEEEEEESGVFLF